MLGDVGYLLVSAGSNATSGAPQQLMFGTYGGLSQLANGEIVNIQLSVSGLDLMVGGTLTTNNIGLPISAAASVFDLPPMRAGDASGLFAARRTGDNASYNWTIWRRLPYTSY